MALKMFGIDGMYVSDGATGPSMAILAGEDMEWQICNGDGSCMSGRLAATSDPNSFDLLDNDGADCGSVHLSYASRDGMDGILYVSHETGDFKMRRTNRVLNPAFIRTHTDECGKCPDEVDNQGNKAVLPGTALAWTLTTTSQSTLISSRNAHGQISDAGAWRTFEIYWTSKTTTHTACSPTAKTRWPSTMRSETA